VEATSLLGHNPTSFSLIVGGRIMDKIKAWQEQYAEAYNALINIDRECMTTKGKGYSLTKLPSKKLGYVYYIRYYDNGIILPTKFTTRTNNRDDAELYAKLNRAQLIKDYYERRKDTGDDLYKILPAYYKRNSPYIEAAKNRGRTFGDKCLSVYSNFIRKVFLPFLQKEKINCFATITPPVISKVQDYLLSRGLKPTSVNRYMGCVKNIFDHLLRDGTIKDNPFNRVRMLSTGKEKIRGCIELEKMRGVFNKNWNDKLSYLLCLVIYTTGMRNSEIERLRVCDIIQIDDCNFIDVKHSKTENGLRLIPLHTFVYKKIMQYTQNNKKNTDDYIFTKRGEHNQSTLYRKANSGLGAVLGLAEKDMDTRGISFYSGRHFWKTMMSAAGLGEDIEEFFMGHKVSADVKKRYNHLDKRGEAALLEKAREVFDAVGFLF
jgi:site-specific recombinase XerD